MNLRLPGLSWSWPEFLSFFFFSIYIQAAQRIRSHSTCQDTSLNLRARPLCSSFEKFKEKCKNWFAKLERTGKMLKHVWCFGKSSSSCVVSPRKDGCNESPLCPVSFLRSALGQAGFCPFLWCPLIYVAVVVLLLFSSIWSCPQEFCLVACPEYLSCLAFVIFNIALFISR